MSVSATNRPVCIQNNNGPLRRLGERPYEGIIPVAKPRTRRTANRTAKAKGKIDALMTTDYGCSLPGVERVLRGGVDHLGRAHRRGDGPAGRRQVGGHVGLDALELPAGADREPHRAAADHQGAPAGPGPTLVDRVPPTR